MTTLAAYLFGYNLNKIAYPWKASILSALAAADIVYFCACPSEDDFEQDLYDTFGHEIEAGRLAVIHRPWGTHYSVQAHIANSLLDQIGTKFDFALKMDADEVICEWSIPLFRKQLDDYNKSGAVLARPQYLHFCPDANTTFPFIYDSKAVISRTSAGLRYSSGHGGDACALGGAPEYQTTLMLHHYGKMEQGREREALLKERSFQKLYVELGFPDPRVEALASQGYMDYVHVFKNAYDKGHFKPYRGRHPIFVQDWLEQMRQRSIGFWKEMGK